MNFIKRRKKRSPVWLIPEEDFINLVKISKSRKDILDHFGLTNRGANHKTLGARIDHLGLDVSHFTPQYKPLKYDLEEILIENSPYRSSLSKRIRKENLLPYICKECNIGPEYNNKILTLELDHINGNHKDNRLENLRFLCPNCHSQTDTSGTKNKKYYLKNKGPLT